MSLSLIVGVLASAAILTAFATAVVLVYRSSHVLAFHVGEVGVASAYVTVAALAAGPGGVVGTLLALAAGVTCALAIALVTHVIVDRLGGARGHFVGTVLTIAIAIVILGVVSLVWSGESKRLVLATGRLAVGDSSVSNNALVVIALCGGAVLLVQALVHFTRFGIDMRAVANSPRLAELRGVPVRRVLLAAWMLAGALAGIGGIGVAAISSVAMEGAYVGVNGVVAAILGGMTSLSGAVLGSILIAVAEHAITVYVDARYSQAVPVLALLLVLAIRPSGLSGRIERIARV